MTEATRITIENIERMIVNMAETEYRRGYADALKEKELTEKHWKQADIMDILHDSWKERIKEREDKTEKPEKSCDTCIHWDKSISHCDFPFTCFSYKWYKSREDKTE